MVYSRTEGPDAGKDKALTRAQKQESATPASEKKEPDFAAILANGLKQPDPRDDAAELGEPAMAGLEGTPPNPAIFEAALKNLNNTQANDTSATPVFDGNTLSNAANFAAQKAAMESQISAARNAIDSMPPGPQKQQALGLLAGIDRQNPNAASDLISAINQIIGESQTLHNGARQEYAEQAEYAREEALRQERIRLDREWEALQKDIRNHLISEKGWSEEQADAFNEEIDEKRDHVIELAEQAKTQRENGDVAGAQASEAQAKQEIEETADHITEVTGSEALGARFIENTGRMRDFINSSQQQNNLPQQPLEAGLALDDNVAEEAKQVTTESGITVDNTAEASVTTPTPTPSGDNAKSSGLKGGRFS